MPLTLHAVTPYVYWQFCNAGLFKQEWGLRGVGEKDPTTPDGLPRSATTASGKVLQLGEEKSCPLRSRIRRNVNRQADGEHRSYSWLALHLNRPAMLLDNAPDHGQAQTGPLPELLGRKERVEDFSNDLLRHAVAGIGNREEDHPAIRHRR